MSKEGIREIIKEAWNRESHGTFGAFLDEAAEKIDALYLRRETDDETKSLKN